MKVCGNLEESWVKGCFRQLRHFRRLSPVCSHTARPLGAGPLRITFTFGNAGWSCWPEIATRTWTRADTAQSWKLTECRDTTHR